MFVLVGRWTFLHSASLSVKQIKTFKQFLCFSFRFTHINLTKWIQCLHNETVSTVLKEITVTPLLCRCCQQQLQIWIYNWFLKIDLKLGRLIFNCGRRGKELKMPSLVTTRKIVLLWKTVLLGAVNGALPTRNTRFSEAKLEILCGVFLCFKSLVALRRD